MKLLVPDIMVPATGEKILRQYKCAKISSDLNNFSSDITVAVTNRRIIEHAESNSKRIDKSNMIHNELFIENVSGISLVRQKIFNRKSFYPKMVIFFIIFALTAAICFWKSRSVYDFLSRSLTSIQYDKSFKIAVVAIPILIYVILMIIFFIFSYHYLISMVIMSKGVTESNVRLDGIDKEIYPAKYIIVPYFNETQKMFTELTSIILDIQKFGPDEIFNHIDSEESVNKVNSEESVNKVNSEETATKVNSEETATKVS